MMKKLLIAAMLLTLYGIMVSAAPPAPAKTPSAKKEDDPVMLKYGVTAEKITAFLKDCNTQITEGNKGKPVQYLTYRLWQNQMNNWAAYTYVELDSNLSRQWLISIGKFFEYLGNCRQTMNELEAAKKISSPEYQTTLANFNTAVQRLKAAVDHPAQANIPGDTLKALRSAKKDALERLSIREESRTPATRPPQKGKR